MIDPEVIKSIIKSNFDDSSEMYVAFEKEYEFFKQLTLLLMGFCDIREGSHVLDVGCGTGASTMVLADVAQKVTGIDLSEKMIIEANKCRKTNIEYVVGDAERLHECVDTQFDAVLYNASIFLLPVLVKSLECARALLQPHGVCGASYPISLYDQGTDLLDEARKSGLACDGSVNKEQNIKEAFGSVFACYDEKRAEIHIDIHQAEAFFLIPAQSASIFPRRPYEERIRLVRTLFSAIAPKHPQVTMVWGLIKSGVVAGH